jgi:hypothetical protein
MRIFVFSLSLMCFLAPPLRAADSSVPADGSGYLNDRKLEMPAVTKPDVKKKPVKKVIEEDPEDPVPVLTQVTGGTPATEDESFPVLALVGGTLVLVALIGGFALFARRSKKTTSLPSPPAAQTVSGSPSVRSPTAAALSRPPAQQASSVKLPPASTTQSEGISINGLSNNEISRLTSVDDRGRNPSGIIIDEDKYFSGGKESFVDEDRS